MYLADCNLNKYMCDVTKNISSKIYSFKLNEWIDKNTITSLIDKIVIQPSYFS